MGILGKLFDKSKTVLGKLKEGYQSFIGKAKEITSKLVLNCGNNRLERQLKAYGSEEIISIKYSRKPIQKTISNIMNVVSLGDSEKKRKELGYQGIYHDGLVVQIASGTFRLEKNASVEINEYLNSENEEVLYPVNIIKGLTISLLLDNASKQNSSFYQYNHQTNNCQSFASDVLLSSGLSVPVEKQDAGALSSTMSSEVNDTMNVMTNLGGIIDRFK
jgi:hypothetical protein